MLSLLVIAFEPEVSPVVVGLHTDDAESSWSLKIAGEWSEFRQHKGFDQALIRETP